MVSYLDVVTILLIFFVAAAAKVASAPVKIVPKPPAVLAVKPLPVQVQPKPEQPKPDPILDGFARLGLETRREPRGLVVELPQALLFSSADDRISEAALPVVDSIAQVLETIPNRVILIGHADAVPIHNRRFNSNWELSVARGMRLLELLSGQYGIDEKRLSVSGDSSNRPADTNDTPQGRASNRRVELVVLDEAAPPINPSPVP